MQLSRCAGGIPPSGEGPGSRMLRPRRDSWHLPYGSRGDVHPLGPDNGLPRKEVIQPHLPVRLPCYDFTPLTLHPFGASLARLGRRLRVQTTRVV